MATLPEQPTLADFQAYIRVMCKERGFDDNSHERKMLLFMEEVGEMAKAIRKRTKLHMDVSKGGEYALEEELADVFMYLLDIANGFDVDLEKAVRDKEAINEHRTWN